MGSTMIWEVDFEDYKSKASFRKKVEEILHCKPIILCDHYETGDQEGTVIYAMSYLGYYDAIIFWKNKGNLNIKNLWELPVCDRPCKWESIKQIFKGHGEEFDK